MPTHDPRREVEKLRDHLASHDKPIAFLIGAGASTAPRDASGVRLDPPLIPPIAALGVRCREAVAALGENYESAYELIEREPTAQGTPNIEDILSRIRLMVAAMGEADALAGMKRPDLQRVEETVRRTIAQAARSGGGADTGAPSTPLSRALDQPYRPNVRS